MGLDNYDATLYSNRSLCFLQIGDGDKAFADAYTCRMTLENRVLFRRLYEIEKVV